MTNISADNSKIFESTEVPPIFDPEPSWSKDDPSHPGFVMNGIDDTPGKKAYLIHLEAKPGKEDKVMAFLRDINNGVNKEPGTGPWFGVRYSKSTFFIFEAFPDAQRRHDHEAGPGGNNFFTRPDELKEILAVPAQLYRLDVLHGKYDVMLGKPVGPTS